MAHALVLSRVVGRVAVVTLNAPLRLNALSVAMGEAFGTAMAALPFDKVGAVVLIVRGQHRLVRGELLRRDAQSQVATLRSADDGQVLEAPFDDVAELTA